MAIGQAARMAGQKLFNVFLKDIPKEQLIARLGMDALGGGMSALYTPGDLGDKLIAGATDAAFSAAGGLALGRVGSPAFRQGFGGLATDMVGSVGGMEVGRLVGDTMQRGKDKLLGGEGLTGYERLSKEQQTMLEEQLKQQVLQQYGLLPGIRPEYYGQDSYLQQLGLG